LVLIVPSVLARVDKNILINPDHPEFGRITTGLHPPVWWDKRLFAG
jgi:RES domain-containing protein